ncbi:MAG: hypothetical protein ACE5HP_02500 [Gemmatimonadota bacterium]
MSREVSGARLRTRYGWRLLAAAAALGAVLLLYDDYGVSWDEPAHSRYGELALDYFASGGHDRSANEYYNLKYYGPLVDMVAAAAYRSRPEHKYETRHLVLGLLALLILPGLILYTRRFGEPLLPAFALLALVMFPRFVGHVFHNSKDIPFATAVTWFMAATTAIFAHRTPPWGRVAGAGLALGVALSVRPGAFPLLALFFLGIATLSRILGPTGEERPSLGLRLRRDSVLLLGWIVMLLAWPWAHGSPILAPLRAMRLSLLFPETYPVLFDGQIVPSNELPAYYLAKYLLITTPPTLLLLAGIGLAASIGYLLRQRRSAKARLSAITLMWLGLPVALFYARQPPAYDGLRHFLFLLPPLAVLAALGAIRLRDGVRRGLGRVAGWGVTGLLLLLPLREMVRLHPYEMTYFNASVGGLPGAAGRYETDYWVLSYREAVRWINERVAAYPDRSFRVLASGSQFVKEVAAYEAAANLEIYTRSELWDRGIPKTDMDFYIGTTRFRNDEDLAQAPIVHSIGREGTTFTVIRQLRSVSGQVAHPASGAAVDEGYEPPVSGDSLPAGSFHSRTMESAATSGQLQPRRR